MRKKEDNISLQHQEGAFTFLMSSLIDQVKGTPST